MDLVEPVTEARHVMGNGHQSSATLSSLPKDVAQQSPSSLVETRGRLVHEPDSRVLHDQASEPQALKHPS
tara:strand:- start:49 stop:258 length:210 start_codon:yes stop_codon:yes gene_type:complete